MCVLARRYRLATAIKAVRIVSKNFRCAAEMVGARGCLAAGLVSVALVLTALPSMGAASDENLMVWNEASNPRALCNDYSRAGYFLRRNPNSSNWIIFLESGSLCFSNETCNRRFFRGEVRLNKIASCVASIAKYRANGA